MIRSFIASLFLFAAPSLRAASITGADWNVYFNLPNQGASTNSPDVYEIRTAIINRLNALQTNQSAMLTAYSWTDDLESGGVDPVLDAINAALNRGASVSMALDKQVSLTMTNLNGISLSNMAARATNGLVYAQASSSSGIMHDKFDLFDYGPSNRWVMTGSWNFSSEASYDEWNIALDVHNNGQLYAAYSNEFSQLLAGHFYNDSTKSHADDHSQFQIAGSWTNGWVRFSPYTNANLGADNALTDITNRIGQAQQEIVFALNDCTQLSVATQIVHACDRGVTVNSVMPKSDTGGSSATVYSYLTNSANYATTNRVNFWTAYATADYTASDSSGYLNLVHCKWMVIDPFSNRPWLIHGSANWSAAAILDTYGGGNNENIVFIPHRDIARTFYSQFKRITGALQTRNDFWFDTATNGFAVWLTDTNSYALDRATSPTGTWTQSGSISNFIGPLAVTNSGAAIEFLRARRN